MSNPSFFDELARDLPFGYWCLSLAFLMPFVLVVASTFPHTTTAQFDAALMGLSHLDKALVIGSSIGAYVFMHKAMFAPKGKGDVADE